MAESVRIRLPAGGDPTLALTVGAGPAFRGSYSDVLPLKEFCVTDDVLRVSDSASFTVANIDGVNFDRFYIGQRVEIEMADDQIGGGQWTRVFTGRVINVEAGSDVGGSVVRVDCMDLGWHLTSCCGPPLKNTNGITLSQLCQLLIDPTWGFAGVGGNPTVSIGNILNRKLKQGRAGVVRSQPHDPTQVLPPIQVEPGQTPWQILENYFKREGFLLNVGAKGDLVVFQPDYATPSPYAPLEYHGSDEGQRTRNNVEGRPTLRKTIDGVYSEYQVWSTVVLPTDPELAAIAQNPNAQYRKESYKPTENPLPFNRLQVSVDSEAINQTMRKNRAIFGYQMGAFDSWMYECDVAAWTSRAPGTNQASFWSSDAMVSLRDSVNGVNEGVYIAMTRKSMTPKNGAQTHLLLRRAGLLDPSLQASVSTKKTKAVK